MHIRLNGLSAEEKRKIFRTLKAGQAITLSGTVYTARDAAHKRFEQIIKNGEKLPFDLDGSVIYYAGPTPAKEGMAIGSCGPTTSARMDRFAPSLYDRGLLATIGKGERDPEVAAACKRNGGVYLCAIGGAGAIAAARITDCEVIAFEDLGCESVKKLEFDEFPLIVATDSDGNDIFSRKEAIK